MYKHWEYEGDWEGPFEVSSETTIDVPIGQVADHYELNQTNQDITAVSKSAGDPITNAQIKTTHVNDLTATSNTTFVEQAGVAQNKNLQTAGQTSVKTDVQTSGLNGNSSNVQQKDNTTQISVLDQLQGQKASQVSGVSTSDQATAPDQAGTGSNSKFVPLITTILKLPITPCIEQELIVKQVISLRLTRTLPITTNGCLRTIC